MEVVKLVIAAFFGGGIAWGAMKSEVANIKETIKHHQTHGERLATIEAKLDLLLTQIKRDERNY